MKGLDISGNGSRSPVGGAIGNSGPKGIDYYEEVINSKDKQIEELKQTLEIMDLKMKKLEQLLTLKDSKIEALLAGKSAAASGHIYIRK